MSWMTAGTAQVTNGSKTVFGTSTAWSVLNSGDIFFLDANKSDFYEIDSVTSDVELILKTPFGGASQTGAAYSVIPQFTNTSNAAILAQLANLLTRMSSRDAELAAWSTGTVTGGPNGNGWYPLTNVQGTQYLVPCPALIAPQPAPVIVPSQMMPFVDLGNVTGSVVLDLSQGSVFKATLMDPDTTISIVNPNTDPTKAEWVRLYLQQGTGSNKASTWPANVFWQGNAFPIWSLTINSIDAVDLVSINGGAVWLTTLSALNYLGVFSAIVQALTSMSASGSVLVSGTPNVVQASQITTTVGQVAISGGMAAVDAANIAYLADSISGDIATTGTSNIMTANGDAPILGGLITADAPNIMTANG